MSTIIYVIVIKDIRKVDYSKVRTSLIIIGLWKTNRKCMDHTSNIV